MQVKYMISASHIVGAQQMLTNIIHPGVVPMSLAPTLNPCLPDILGF